MFFLIITYICIVLFHDVFNEQVNTNDKFLYDFNKIMRNIYQIVINCWLMY